MMNKINASVIDSKSFIESSPKDGFAKRMVKGLKNYWSKNSEVIVSGLASMNGQYIIPIKSR